MSGSYHFGSEHPNTATSLNNLAELYRAQGRYGEAEPLMKRALASDEKALGPNHTDVGTDLNNLALLHYAQGRYTDAEPLFKRSLGIQEKALGPDHLHVAQLLNSLADMYRKNDRSKEADELMNGWKRFDRRSGRNRGGAVYSPDFKEIPLARTSRVHNLCGEGLCAISSFNCQPQWSDDENYVAHAYRGILHSPAGVQFIP